ncbi:MAG: helix-turn-helix domain-containing protein [Bacilli bacterium]|nr:helix-turn-helix domain-containing protein [Bacilli bacterium]
MSLGTRIKKFRTEKGLTQKELADQVHVTFQTVSKWEKDENEPDVSTLRELSKLFGCSLDDLLSEEEKETPKEELVEEVKEEQPVVKTVVIHEKELHVCEKCKKDIPENDLVMEDICVHPYRRGRAAEYRKAYYHSACLKQVQDQRAIDKIRKENAFASRNKKLSFGWGIAAGVVGFIVSLLIFLLVPSIKVNVHPGLAVLWSVIISYALFAMVYCIITGSYIGDVFAWCAGLSIRFPGIIFSWDLEGFAFLIVMKILFAVLGFLIGVLALMFAIVFSAALGSVSFPFVLIHNINNNYQDAF